MFFRSQHSFKLSMFNCINLSHAHTYVGFVTVHIGAHFYYWIIVVKAGLEAGFGLHGGDDVVVSIIVDYACMLLCACIKKINCRVM
jgi:hypothetical protein